MYSTRVSSKGWDFTNAPERMYFSIGISSLNVLVASFSMSPTNCVTEASGVSLFPTIVIHSSKLYALLRSIPTLATINFPLHDAREAITQLSAAQVTGSSCSFRLFLRWPALVDYDSERRKSDNWDTCYFWSRLEGNEWSGTWTTSGFGKQRSASKES